mgnify:CR=1 FL=1
MVVIQLSRMEFEYAAFVGLQRTTQRMFNGGKHAYGARQSKGLFDTNLGGSVAEYAVAKFLQCNWSNDPESTQIPDVGGIVEVRSTPHEDGMLRIHEADKDHLPYVLALTHELPIVRLVGWTYGRDGKDPAKFKDVWNTGRPAFWVPQHELMGMNELKERYEAWRIKKEMEAP